MKYRSLGGTGTTVASLALGTMGFGTETPGDEALAVIDAYVEAGGNTLDTSDIYGAGASEATLGRWFASRPTDVTDRVVLATKGRFGTGRTRTTRDCRAATSTARCRTPCTGSAASRSTSTSCTAGIR